MTFLFVYCFLFVNYYSKILLQFCQLYSMDHFIADMDPLPDAESGKRTLASPTRLPWQCLILMDTFWEGGCVLLLASQ